VNNDAIPGIMPTSSPVPEMIMRTLQAIRVRTFKGRSYQYVCVAGSALEIDVIGQVPKKVRRPLEREWRKLNPPRDRTVLPKIPCRYHREVLLRDWLHEKVKEIR
jgi:hypothetical protein